VAGNRSNLRDMTGRTVVITDGNSGIGDAPAEALARPGARVVIAALDADRGSAAVTEIRQASGNDNVEYVPLDLSSITPGVTATTVGLSTGKVTVTGASGGTGHRLLGEPGRLCEWSRSYFRLPLSP
jgi:NAD(P)-dependent dehydrogenase (short-subunit alcohol dehydrogenase family)